MDGTTLYELTRDAQTQQKKSTLNPGQEAKTIDKLPDKLLLHIFSYLRHHELGGVASVSQKWLSLVNNPQLWTRVSLRPEYSNLCIKRIEYLIYLINNRFNSALRYLELPCELITAPVLHELSARCPNLRDITLDFSKAMQLHDFNDLNSFPCNLKSLTICLSEVIFLEGFMRKVYSSLSSVQILHLIGTFEHSDEHQEEIYEVINLGKIRTYTPNLTLVNLYGISFIDDSHIEMLAGNCIHLSCLAMNYCLRVKGGALKTLIQRCRKLKTLLLQHCALDNAMMLEVDWADSSIVELDLSSTELNGESLTFILTSIKSIEYLAVAHCEFFEDKLLDELTKTGKFDKLRALDVSYTESLSENSLTRLFKHPTISTLEGLIVTGKPRLAEQFFLNIVPYISNIKILSFGTVNGWFVRLSMKVHIDQLMICLAQNCTRLQRLEIQWDPDTLRYGDNSSKFIDQLRLKCQRLKSLTLSDGEYYEMVKSNYERADRYLIVRTTINYTTSIVSLLSSYNQLLFN